MYGRVGPAWRGTCERENGRVETRLHTGARVPGRAEGYSRDANAESQLRGSCHLSPIWPLTVCEMHALDSPNSRGRGLSLWWT